MNKGRVAKSSIGRSRSKPKRKLFRVAGRTVFLNVPYDEKFENLYLAFIAGLCGFGLTPRATLEIVGSRRRLDRIISLIRSCRYSIHDLSRVELDCKTPRTPRFNMPFELGAVVGLCEGRRREHQWFVFEALPHRLNKSLSDLDGTDPYVHGGKPDGVLRAITNAFSRRGRGPSLSELRLVCQDLGRVAAEIKKRWGGSLFEAHPFGELVVSAGMIAKERISA